MVDKKELKEFQIFDRVEIIFLDAHTLHKAWVHFDEFKEWVENSQVYVHVSGHYLQHNDKFVTICLGYGAFLGSAETDQIVDPFSIPIGAIMEIHKLERCK